MFGADSLLVLTVFKDNNAYLANALNKATLRLLTGYITNQVQYLLEGIDDQIADHHEPLEGGTGRLGKNGKTRSSSKQTGD
jgi:hypothetical protein